MRILHISTHMYTYMYIYTFIHVCVYVYIYTHNAGVSVHMARRSLDMCMGSRLLDSDQNKLRHRSGCTWPNRPSHWWGEDLSGSSPKAGTRKPRADFPKGPVRIWDEGSITRYGIDFKDLIPSWYSN